MDLYCEYFAVVCESFCCFLSLSVIELVTFRVHCEWGKDLCLCLEAFSLISLHIYFHNQRRMSSSSPGDLNLRHCLRGREV